MMYISTNIGILVLAVLTLVTNPYEYNNPDNNPNNNSKKCTKNCVLKYAVLLVLPVAVILAFYIYVFVTDTVVDHGAYVLAGVLAVVVGFLGYLFVRDIDNIMNLKAWVMCGEAKNILDYSHSISAVCVLYRDASLFILAIIQIIRMAR